MLQTNQKPLQAILSNSLVEATPWMQGLLLPTIPYDRAVEYIKGETKFIADCLSRAPVAKDTIKLPILQVNQITAHAAVSDLDAKDTGCPSCRRKAPSPLVHASVCSTTGFFGS